MFFFLSSKFYEYFPSFQTYSRYMQKKAVSIGDIARELNVSITTVSFILNGKAEEKRISKALTTRVTRLANKVGYVPNHLAKSLRTRKTNIIGLIVEDISN